MNRQEFVGLVTIGSCLLVAPLTMPEDILISNKIERAWIPVLPDLPLISRLKFNTSPLYYSEVEYYLNHTKMEWFCIRGGPQDPFIHMFLDCDIKNGLRGQTRDQRIITIQRYKD